jgi:hypothetical protein
MRASDAPGEKRARRDALKQAAAKFKAGHRP